jgi:hypothetical protein
LEEFYRLYIKKTNGLILIEIKRKAKEWKRKDGLKRDGGIKIQEWVSLVPRAQNQEGFAL